MAELTRMLPEHWPAVERIYREGIASGNATFEAAPPTWSEWDQRHLRSCRLLLHSGVAVWGWAALSPVSSRPVYRGVAEVSVYVAAGERGKGNGSRLLGELVACSERCGLWTLQAGIFPENEASVALHRAHGFRLVGRRERLGRHAGVWRDVLLLERRSVVAGV